MAVQKVVAVFAALWCCAVLLCNGDTTCNMLVGSFNIQVLGVSKLSKGYVVEQLVKIIRRYDALLIQEVRDASGETPGDLLAAVSTTAMPYASIVSARLGRTSSKEQYVLFYRSDKLRVPQWYVYDDSAADVFEREPVVIELAGAGAYSQCFSQPFSMIGIHVKPSDVPEELAALVAVYNASITRLGTTNSLITGDMNADCSYLSNTAASKLAIFTDPRFDSLIDKMADTTVALSSCAYDRIIVAGTYLQGIVDRSSVGVYRFDTALGLNHSVAEDVSDHYPVEVILQGSGTVSIDPGKPRGGIVGGANATNSSTTSSSTTGGSTTAPPVVRTTAAATPAHGCSCTLLIAAMIGLVLARILLT